LNTSSIEKSRALFAGWEFAGNLLGISELKMMTDIDVRMYYNSSLRQDLGISDSG
jgi:hypothetical protein